MIVPVLCITGCGKVTCRQHQDDAREIDYKPAFTQVMWYQPKIIDVKKGNDQYPVHHIPEVLGRFNLRLGDQRR
jgi:hypothetical protein